MKNILIITLILLLSLIAKAETIRIAVIDTGFDFNSKITKHVKLCKTGHKDLTNTGLHDTNGHGTHIASLIATEAKNSDYCLIIIKYYDASHKGYISTGELSALAISWAIQQKVDIINYSSGGTGYVAVEKMFVDKALDNGIIFVAAAGNESTDLNKGHYYPAMYDKRIIVVGNVDKNGRRSPSSNFNGPTDLSVIGENVEAACLNERYCKMTGTSQSTAKVTGRVINQVYMRQVLRHNYEFFGNVSSDNYRFEYEKYMAQ